MKGVLVYISALTFMHLIEFIRTQDPTIVNPVNIPNCVESYLDNNSIERCSICQAGFTKSYEMTVCKLQTLSGCIWTSRWGCLECSCGWVASNDLQKCVTQTIEGCLRLDSTGNGCIQPKLGYTIVYTMSGTTFTYQSIKADTGQYCGWQLQGGTGCTKCQPGYFLETGGLSCKKLSIRLQNENTFWLSSNSLATPLTTIQVIPGWETVMTGLTNAGAFPYPISNCKTYDNTLNNYSNVALCTQCSSGNVLTQNQLQCVTGDNLCAYADNFFHYCIQCKDPLNYYADKVQNKCLIRDVMFDNCSVRSLSADQCTTCKTNGYILNANHCIYVANCATSDGTANCLTCNQQFYLATSTSCLALPPNCTAVTAGNCSACATNYYLNAADHTCYFVGPNCQTVTALVCSACNTGYHLVNNICYIDIPNCVTHIALGQDGCLQCASMYVPSTDASECLLHNLQFQEYCQNTDGKGNCLQCLSLKYIPKCLDITNVSLCLVSDGKNNQCIQCLPNAFLNSSNICIAADSTCLRTDGSSQCKQCQMGYYINATTNRCVQIPSCQISDGVSNVCLACLEGYILYSNQCNVILTGCAIQVGTSCQQCQSGYGLSAGACTLIANCLISSGLTTTCYQCAVGMQLNTGANTCGVFNSNPALQPPQFCSVFYAGFSNLKDSTCTLLPLVPNYGYCLSCQSPLVMQLSIDGTTCANSSAVTQSCVQLSTIGTLIDNCRVYDFTPGKCRICENNYSPDANGLCVTNSIANCQNTIDPLTFANTNNCKVCMPGVYQTNNTCKTAVQNCASYTTSGCTSCLSQFYFNVPSQLCIPYAGQQCSAWSDAAFTQCSTCNAGFTYTVAPNTNICLYNPYNSGACANIVIRDPLNNQYCLSIATLPDPNCAEYNSSGVCSRCKSGFLLQKSTNNQIYLVCTAKSANCSAINTNGQSCLTCAATYYLNLTFNAPDCVQITNCASPTTQGDGTGCKQCSTTGYYLDSSGFLCNQMANCVTSVDGINPFCQQCVSLMYPSVGGVCVNLNMSGCLASDGISQKCTQCTDLFYLDSTGICRTGNQPSCLKYTPLGNPTSSTVCGLCSPGYKLTSPTCTALANCQMSDGTATAVCTSCQDYYYYNTAQQKCLPPDTPINYCRRYQDDTQACIACDIPYYLVGQVCTSRTTRNDFCSTYNLATKPCTLCNTQPSGGVIVTDPYSPKFGYCQQIQITSCNIYMQNQPKCQVCSQNVDEQVGWLTSSKNFCKDVTTMNCLTVNPQGNKCLTCQQGVYALLPSTGLCYPVCTTGYLVAGTPPTCTPYTAAKVANCDMTNPVGDGCLVCSKGYVMNSTTNICTVMNVTNCADNGPSRGQNCQQCNPGFYLLNNQCLHTSVVANCATQVITTDECGYCAIGFYLSADRKSCLPITATNCKISAIDSDTCLLCKDSTYTVSFDGKACFTGRAASHCIVSSTTTSSGQCQVCEPGYIVVTNQQTCILNTFNLPGCTSVQQLSGNTYYSCSTCKSSYNLVNNVCIPAQGLSSCFITNCQTYSSFLYDSAVCKTCVALQDPRESYQLVNNTCVFVMEGAILQFTSIAAITLLMLLF